MKIVRCKKTFKQVLIHWYYVNKVFIKYFGLKQYLFSECYKHDLDKLIPILLNRYSKEHHRLKSKHHLNNVISQSKECHYYEMVADWESARYSKKSKQLTAKEYWDTIDKTSIKPDIKSKIETIINKIKY